MDNEDPFDPNIVVPGMPSDDEIRKSLVASADVLMFPTHNSPPRQRPFDLSGYSAETRDKIIASRLRVGPGEHANHYQRAVHNQFMKHYELRREADRLTDDLTANAGFDPVTGDPIFLYSPERRKGIVDELARIADELKRIEGNPGRENLAKELEIAVVKEKAAYQRRYIEAEAQRRAQTNAMEDRIQRRAADIRRGSVGLNLANDVL
ncbi:hypothetical protein P1X14_11140 [Sphingomonas sp. AOB5]|uniref:hypothetical protein n=1 Tax=Sphingomonas sp. AOB5 TaxID=3034017 RepID=UPI0023F62B79|nr:hypothetical protein [Sphingomonas sp. AOB5]MDF7775802.1 hypothetical protein [Sphingomonas sp. AOB5]